MSNRKTEAKRISLSAVLAALCFTALLWAGAATAADAPPEST
jgi:hypothetical protein